MRNLLWGILGLVVIVALGFLGGVRWESHQVEHERAEAALQLKHSDSVHAVQRADSILQAERYALLLLRADSSARATEAAEHQRQRATVASTNVTRRADSLLALLKAPTPDLPRPDSSIVFQALLDENAALKATQTAQQVELDAVHQQLTDEQAKVVALTEQLYTANAQVRQYHSDAVKWEAIATKPVPFFSKPVFTLATKALAGYGVYRGIQSLTQK